VRRRCGCSLLPFQGASVHCGRKVLLLVSSLSLRLTTRSRSRRLWQRLSIPSSWLSDAAAPQPVSGVFRLSLPPACLRGVQGEALAPPPDTDFAPFPVILDGLFRMDARLTMPPPHKPYSGIIPHSASPTPSTSIEGLVCSDLFSSPTADFHTVFLPVIFSSSFWFF